MRAITNKEMLQHQLTIIHNHTDREEEIYLASIRANIQMKWNATSKYIQGLRESERRNVCH